MTATDYAQSVTGTPDAFSWRALERHALAPYPSLPPLLDAQTARLSAMKTTPWHETVRFARALVLLAAGLAPFITSGILLAGSRADGNAATLLAWAAPFAVAHIVLRVREWILAARGSNVQPPSEIAFAGFSIVFSALTVLPAWIDASISKIPGAWWYVALFLVMTLACVASFIMMIVRRRAYAAGRLNVIPRGPDQVLAAAVAALREDEREAIKSDISGALDILAESGAITDAERTKALTYEIGGLGRWRWTTRSSRAL